MTVTLFSIALRTFISADGEHLVLYDYRLAHASYTNAPLLSDEYITGRIEDWATVTRLVPTPFQALCCSAPAKQGTQTLRI